MWLHQLREMKEEGEGEKKTPNIAYQSLAGILQNAILHYIWVFCLYSVGDSLILPTLIKWMGACTAIWWGFSIKTAAEGSLLPPERTLHAAAHSAGAFGKAPCGTEANLAVHAGHAESTGHHWGSTWSRQLLRHGWQQISVVLCTCVCVNSGLCETVAFLPPSSTTHSMTRARAILRKFLWFTLKFSLAEFYPFEHLKIIPFLS